MDQREAAATRQAFEYGASEVLSRIQGLTDDEYLWEPVPGCWTVRRSNGGFVADYTPGVDAGPFTTIAWRLWHIAADCLDSYSRRAFDRPGPEDEAHFVGTASEAIARLHDSIENFLTGLEALGQDVWKPLGPGFGPFAQASYVDLTLHANREIIHHGAEIGVLRDLYRTRSEVSPGRS